MENEQVDKDYKALFLQSPMGPKVLGKMLDEVDFFNIARDPEYQVAQNELKTILTRCGIGLGMTGEKFIRRLAGKNAANALTNSEDDNGGDE